MLRREGKGGGMAVYAEIDPKLLRRLRTYLSLKQMTMAYWLEKQITDVVMPELAMLMREQAEELEAANEKAE